MIISGLDTSKAADQLSLLFDIEAIFKRRGRLVLAYEDDEKLLFDPSDSQACESCYQALSSNSFRRIVGLVANSEAPLSFEAIQSECTDLTESKVQSQLARAVDLCMIRSSTEAYEPVSTVGFGSTFEWYVAAVCIEELASISYWGVQVEDLSGDYDVVVIRENQLGYIECKTGRFSNITGEDVKNSLVRASVLGSNFTIFLVDQISRENVDVLARYALEQEDSYRFEVPGGSILFKEESYRNFVRIMPINTFILSVADRSVGVALKEIYQFLTLVPGRALPSMENEAAKEQFGLLNR